MEVEAQPWLRYGEAGAEVKGGVCITEEAFVHAKLKLCI